MLLQSVLLFSAEVYFWSACECVCGSVRVDTCSSSEDRRRRPQAAAWGF